MADVRVVDTSALLALANVGRLDLLTSRQQQLIVPEAVAVEVLAGPPSQPARVALDAGFGAPFQPVTLDPEVLAWSLGAGESAVLSLARSRGALAILDDQEARRAARTLGVRVTGTLGIVLQGVREGHVASGVQIVRELRAGGLWLDDRVVADALARYLGETWEP